MDYANAITGRQDKMTEKLKFGYVNLLEVEAISVDGVCKYYFNECGTVQAMVDLLNGYHIQNRDLFEENRQLKKDLEDAYDANGTLESEIIKLREEKEDLKKEIKRLKVNVKRFKEDRDSNFESVQYWRNKYLKE